MTKSTRPGMRSVIPTSMGSRDRSKSRWVPRLGTSFIVEPPRRASGCPSQTPGGIDDPAGTDVDVHAIEGIMDRQPRDPAVRAVQDRCRPGPRHGRGAESLRRARHGQAEAGVVLDAVGVGDAATQAGAPDGRDELGHRARREVVGASPVACGPEEVVHRQTGAVEGAMERRDSRRPGRGSARVARGAGPGAAGASARRGPRARGGSAGPRGSADRRG